MEESGHIELTRPCALARGRTLNLDDTLGQERLVEMVALKGIPNCVIARSPSKVWMIPLQGEAVEVTQVAGQHLVDLNISCLTPLPKGRIAIRHPKKGGGFGSVEVWNTQPCGKVQAFKAPFWSTIDGIVQAGPHHLGLCIRRSDKSPPARLWDWKKGAAEETKILVGPTWHLIGALDENALLFTDQNKVRLINPKSAAVIVEADAHRRMTRLRALRLDEDTLAVCSERHTGRGSLIVQCFNGHTGWIGPEYRNQASEFKVELSGHHLLRTVAKGVSVVDLKTHRLLAQLSPASGKAVRGSCMLDNHRFLCATEEGILEEWELMEELVQICPQRGVEVKELAAIFDVTGQGFATTARLGGVAQIATGLRRLVGIGDPQPVAESLSGALSTGSWRTPEAGTRDVLLWLLKKYPGQAHLALLNWSLEASDRLKPRHLELLFNGSSNIALARIPFCLTELLFVSSEDPAEKELLSEILFRALDVSAHQHMVDRKCISAFKQMTRRAMERGILSQGQIDELESTAEDHKTFNTARFRKVEYQIKMLRQAVDANRRNIKLLGKSLQDLEGAFKRKGKREVLFGLIKVVCFFAGDAIVGLAENLINLTRLTELGQFIPEIEPNMLREGFGELVDTVGDHVSDRPIEGFRVDRQKFEQYCGRAKGLLKGMDVKIEAPDASEQFEGAAASDAAIQEAEERTEAALKEDE